MQTRRRLLRGWVGPRARAARAGPYEGYEGYNARRTETGTGM